MLEIFKLVGSVFVDTDAAEKSLSKTDEKAEGVGKKLASGIKTAAKWGAALAAGATVAAGAVASVAKKSVEAYSEYEQLKGGVETLFGAGGLSLEEYAKSVGKTTQEVKGEYDNLIKAQTNVLNNANDAYKNAGMSANEYIETVTSFSASLVSSLGGDTVKAAAAADLAITDMSDNANKMGTDISSIQNAYQGFAKQNYTMLDNLKLGYGGTQKEMQRLLEDATAISGVKYDISNLNDVYSAIHVIQTEMGITGTTANEAATTIQGSIGSMKAAYENLIVGLADPDQDLGVLINNMTETATTALGNIAPRIVEILPRISEGLSLLITQVTTILPPLIESLLPPLLSAAVSLVNGVVAAAPQLVSIIIGILPQLIEGINEMAQGIIAVLPAIIQTLADALARSLPLLITAAIQLLVMLMNNFQKIIAPIISALPQIIISVVTALLDNLPALIQGAINLALGLVKAVDQIIAVLVPMIPTIILQVVAAIIKEIPTLIAGALQLVDALAQAVGTWYASWISGFGAAFNKIISKAAEFFASFKTSIQAKLEEIKANVSEKFESIKTAVSTKINAVKTTVTTVFNAIKTAITSPIEAAKNTVKGVIDKIKSFFNFTVTLPHIKLPHFSIKPSGWKLGDLLKGSIPSLGINWYAKGGVFEDATLFNYGNGRLGGLGESGAEAVVPLDQNKKWINKVAQDMDTAVGGAAGKDITARLDDILAALEELLGVGIYLDTGAMVGALARPMDKKLGQFAAQKARA